MKTANKIWNSQDNGRLQLGIIHVMLPGDSLSVFQTVLSSLPASSEFQTFFFLLSCRKTTFRKNVNWSLRSEYYLLHFSVEIPQRYICHSFKTQTYRIRLRGPKVARLTPDQKVACSNHVGVKVSPFYMTTVLFKDNSFSLSDDLPYWGSSFDIYLVKETNTEAWRVACFSFSIRHLYSYEVISSFYPRYIRFLLHYS